MMIDAVLLLAKSAVSVQLPVFTTLAQAALLPILTTRDCGPEPIRIPFDWEPLAGTDGIEVDPTVLRIGPPGWNAAPIPLGEIVHRADAGQIVVEIPAGHRVRSLHLAGLRDATADVDLSDEADLDDWRLAVTPVDPSGRYFAPVVTVPAVRARGQRAAMFVGGSLHDRTLSLPDLEAASIRLALVKGEAPEFTDSHTLEVDRVTGWAAPHPHGLTVAGPDGATLWSFPETLLPGTPTADADLTVGVQGFLDAAFAAGGPLGGEVTVTAARPGRVGLSIPAVRGALLRNVSGTTTAALAGDPTGVPLDGDLPAELPSSVVADVHVRYDGIRLAEISDLLPSDRAVAGTVVGAEPVVRVLPPGALRDEQLARVGVVGRAPAACEMSIHVVDCSPGADHAPLAPPAVSTVGASTASDDFEVVWATFDPPLPIDRPIGISATATTGTFWWVGEPDPLVRLAIIDPDPGGRPILLAGETLLTLDEPTLTVTRASLPGAGFAGGASASAPLTLASALYCAIELTDLTLRYARPKNGT